MTAVTLLSLAGAAVPAGSATAITLPQADPPPSPTKLFTIRDARIDESSGLAKSQKYEDLWWTVNDSGDTARVFGINNTGKLKAVLSFKAPVKDVEAVAVDKDGTIYIADIGDNKADRDMIEVYTIPEPDKLADATSVKFHRFDFKYPDGAHDAETLLINPQSRQLFFVTKVAKGLGGIYAAPETASREGTNELTKIAEGPAGVTDGTFMPDGQVVVLRSYVDVARVAWGEAPKVVGRAGTPLAQGESVAVASNEGNSILVGSEGKGSAVYEMAVPAAKAGTTSPSATPTPKNAAADSGDTKKSHNLRWIIIGAALFAFVITIITFPPGRRERLDRMAENARLTGQAPPNEHPRRRTPAA
ncbi:esterase-like activity of phytase family protein [Kribbella qitaiheensis]|uniref:esterase-like activity of phytase family protein n=1 Tax=Kribbella qitaiheensis TaxID=1544730 RepID=UPI001FE2F803|nr:esterase-like activity of phytase family protein [Kribbella qitaiheensis]